VRQNYHIIEVINDLIDLKSIYIGLNNVFS